MIIYDFGRVDAAKNNDYERFVGRVNAAKIMIIKDFLDIYIHIVKRILVGLGGCRKNNDYI